MVTISFQQILTLVLANWISLTRGPDGIPEIARPIVFGFSFADSNTYLALCVGMRWVVGFCVGRLKHSKLGRAMQAVRDNELAAGVAGVDTYWTKVIAFTLSALLGGLGLCGLGNSEFDVGRNLHLLLRLGIKTGPP